MTCFASDATWQYAGLPDEIDRSRPFFGHDELRQLAIDLTSSSGGQMLHVVHLQLIDGEGDTARTVHYGEVLRRGQAPNAGVILTDIAEDTLVRVAGGWVFQSRAGYVDSHRRLPPSSDVLVAARDAFVGHVLHRILTP